MPDLYTVISRAIAQHNEPGSPPAAILPAEGALADAIVRALRSEGRLPLPTATTLRTIALTALGHERGVFPGDLDQRDQLAAYAIADAILENLESGGYGDQAQPLETPQEPVQSARITHTPALDRIATLENRCNALEITVRNVIELDRHVAQLREALTTHMGRTWNHATEHTHDTDPTHTVPADEERQLDPDRANRTAWNPTEYHDDDQRLGGHDNPHHDDSETT